MANKAVEPNEFIDDLSEPESNNVTKKKKKKVFICHPDNPDPTKESYYSYYRGKIFLDSIKIFADCLEKEGSLDVICRNNFSSDDNDLTVISNQIQQCNVVLVICCPAIVYLLSAGPEDDVDIGENLAIVELKTIQGQSLVSNAIKVIPVVINNTTDNIQQNIPTYFVQNNPVKISIATPAFGEYECWPAQNRSITHLINIIHGDVVIPTDPDLRSPISESEVVDMDWCVYFIDQFGIDFVASIFEERCIEKDTNTLEQYLNPKERGLSFRELLRVWLRRLRKSEFLFDELLSLLAEFGREDLMFQLQAQFEVYKIHVYNYQNKAHCEHSQAKPPRKLQ